MLGMTVSDPLYGDAEVLRVLLRRRAARGRGAARHDPHRVALVVGGGGMRGAYTAGMLNGLESAGLRSSIDEVFGASSGAFGAAAFAVGQAQAGAACYPEDLATRKFINLARLGTRRPVVSLDYLLGEVLEVRKPLPWDLLGSAPIATRIVATDRNDLTAHTLEPVTADHWREAIRASASIPLLAGPPVSFGGREWIDGSVAEPLAVARALRAGATHVLALLCRGRGELHSGPHAELSWWAKGLDRFAPGLGTVAQGSRRYGDDLRLITRAPDPLRPEVRLAAIGPDRGAGVGGLCTDRAALQAAVQIGEHSMVTAIEGCSETAPTPGPGSVSP
jgi:predicted patatin/cPLA2 family phospholipase